MARKYAVTISRTVIERCTFLVQGDSHQHARVIAIGWAKDIETDHDWQIDSHSNYFIEGSETRDDADPEG